MITSSDGVQWQAAPTSFIAHKVQYGDGFFWASGNSQIQRSTNGIDWEQVWSGQAFGNMGTIAARDGKVMAIAGWDQILSSTNRGATWNAWPMPQRYSYAGAAAIGNGVFLGLLSGTFEDQSITVARSEDGVSWATTNLTFRPVPELAFVNGVFVGITLPKSAVDGTYTSQVIASADGIAWNATTFPADFWTFHAAFGDGVFVVGGMARTPDQHWSGCLSTNLTQWQPLDLQGVTNITGATAGAADLCYGAGTFVAVGGNLILQSDHLDKARPLVTTQPKATAAYEGGTARFNVGVFGTQPFTYQWRHNQFPIAGATNEVLTIRGVQLADAGNYDVVVSNEAGTAISDAAWLHVSWVTIAKYAGITLTGDVGSSVRIECVDSVNSTNWVVLTNVSLPTSPYLWMDVDSPRYPTRFYRAQRQ